MRPRTLLLALAPLLLAADESRPLPAAPIALPIDPSVFDGVPIAEHATPVADYTLTAKLDPVAHTVHGEGTIVWRNTSRVPVQELYLHLYLNGFKNEQSLFLRGPALRVSGGVRDYGSIDVRRLALREGATETELTVDTTGAPPNQADQTDAHVALPRPVAPGESITLAVVFDDKLPTVLERTGYAGSFHFVAQWFPKIARLEPDGHWAHFPFHHLSEFYADFGTYDVTLDVPAGFVVGATGPLAEEPRVEGDRRIERHVQGDIHDFAFTAWDRYQRETATMDGVAVTVLFPTGYRSVALRELAAVRVSLPYFGALYGPYPYPVLTIVHPPSDAEGAGGMEYPTLITTGGPWYCPSGVFVPEYVTIHEFGHQYFYGLVATDEHTWPFLDEGVNSYAQVGALRAMRGGAKSSFADILGLKVDLGEAQAVFSNHSVHFARVAQPAPSFANGREYSNLVYSRTAAILETLERVYGEGKMALALGRYARQQRFLHPGPNDLLDAIGEVLGKTAADTARTALFDKGWVDYSVEAVTTRRRTTAAGLFDKNGQRETVAGARAEDGAYEGTVLVARKGTLAFPVQIELTFDDGTTERRTWDDEGDETRVTYVGPKRLRSAVIDPDHAVLLDQDARNNHGSAPEVGRATVGRTLERATYWGQLVMQAVSP